MSTLSTLLSSKTWTLPVDGGVDGTLVIGWSFVFLAYFLHPAIESAYHRLRAYRAWRCIQKRQTVEVTTYPLLAEVFGGRGKWDAARNITVVLAAFSLASWGLELSMDLSSLEGEADLLNRPPPVFLRPDTNDTTTDPWQVGFVVRESPVDLDAWTRRVFVPFIRLHGIPLLLLLGCGVPESCKDSRVVKAVLPLT